MSPGERQRHNPLQTTIALRCSSSQSRRSDRASRRRRSRRTVPPRRPRRPQRLRRLRPRKNTRKRPPAAASAGAAPAPGLRCIRTVAGQCGCASDVGDHLRPWAPYRSLAASRNLRDVLGAAAFLGDLVHGACQTTKSGCKNRTAMLFDAPIKLRAASAHGWLPRSSRRGCPARGSLMDAAPRGSAPRPRAPIDFLNAAPVADSHA